LIVFRQDTDLHKVWTAGVTGFLAPDFDWQLKDSPDSFDRQSKGI